MCHMRHYDGAPRLPRCFHGVGPPDHTRLIRFADGLNYGVRLVKLNVFGVCSLQKFASNSKKVPASEIQPTLPRTRYRRSLSVGPKARMKIFTALAAAQICAYE